MAGEPSQRHVRIFVDGQEMEAREGATVLKTLLEHGVRIPTLCYHPALRPIGACKLCAVEVTGPTGLPVTRLACILRVREGLQIKTRSEQVSQSRVRAMRLLLSMAPQAKRLLDLAREFDIDAGPPPDGCIRCRLCIRVCSEVVGPGALRMEKQEGRQMVVPIPDRCIGCGTCANICPTHAIGLQDDGSVRTITIRDEIIGSHHLERCQACGKYFASEKFLSHVEHRIVPRHPDVKEHHLYCPTCAKLFSDRVQSFRPLRRM